jgi:tetratricopeptide (TPR) repeat protein
MLIQTMYMSKNKKNRKEHSNLVSKTESQLLSSWRPCLWIAAVGMILYAQTLFFDLTTHDDTFLINNNDEIIRDISKALELNPPSYELHNNYGIHLSKRNLLTEAEGEFQRAIALNPQYGNAHLNLGYLYYVLQKSASAEKHFDIAQKLGVPVPDEFLAPSSSQK